MTDDGPSGAVDNDYDDAVIDFDEDTKEELGPMVREFWPEERPEIALDLVTRQPLVVIGVTADSVVDHWNDTGFNLLTYKGHRYLPVSRDDTVYKCVFIPRKAKDVHTAKKTYDFPRGRLMRVPIEQAWEGD